jgi:hypothetical protein
MKKPLRTAAMSQQSSHVLAGSADYSQPEA